MKPASKSRTAKQPDRKRSSRSPSAELAGQIQLLRMRVTGAEATLKQARAQSDQAKRRRKIAKLLAKRARKGAKQAKAELQEVREALARAEAALIAKNQPRATKRKPRKPRTGGRSVAPPAQKQTVALRKRRTPSRSKLQSPASVAPPALPNQLVENAVPPTTESPQGSDPEVIAETTNQN